MENGTDRAPESDQQSRHAVELERGAVGGIRPRIRYLVERCRGKRALHVGCTNSPMTAEALRKRTLLHTFLAESAQECVGVDISEEGLELVRRAMPECECIVGDVTRVETWPDVGRFDVIVAGEILEHLERPADALRGLSDLLRSDGRIIVTLPNAFSIKGTLRAALHREIVHRDHLAYYSPRVLRSLAERSGLSVSALIGYVNHSERPLIRLLQLPVHLLVRISPNLADGLIAELLPAEPLP